MRLNFALLALAATALAGCSTGMADQPQRGLEAVNVPVVTRSDYVLDLASPGGSLAPSEAARLDGWFRGMDLGYGDAIYVDGPYADEARRDVADVAGVYGIMVQPGAPVSAGVINPGTVRVIVSRTRAVVPNCPNWSEASAPNFHNRAMSNFGCAVNSNIAAMVADPRDLVRGRAGTGVSDTLTADKAIDYYRKAEPTGSKGLQDVNTKKDDK